jgi:hypothetical protein
MSSIPIVQGTAVEHNGSKYGQAPPPPSYASNDGEDQQYFNYSATEEATPERRQNPPKQYQDVAWALLFVAHLIAMLVVISMGLTGSNQNAYGGGYGGTIFVVVGVTGLSSLIFSSLALSQMMKHTEILVQVALIFSVLCSLAIGIVGFMIGSIMTGVIGLIAFAFGCCYAKIVWPRIPFAATNLETALSAVRANLGLAIAAYGMTALAFVWSFFWFTGLADAFAGSNLGIIFLLFLSFYWVHQVLQNTMHVITAGVIGTWWFVPSEASTFWSKALTDSFFRATTFSFGSICFGSFIVAVVQALRALEYYARDQNDFQFLVCIIQCILGCIESVLEYFNKWAYVYVGLYGFSYLDAGRNVVQLFQNKGWTAVISDDLCDNVLFMVSIAIGLASGLIGLIIGFTDSGMFVANGYDHAGGPAFLIGFLVGYLFASVLLSIVSSAVNTVIVCYAEAPAEFQMNHPKLSSDMRAAYSQAFPDIPL